MKKMTTNSRSIRTQMNRMLLIMSILFVVLCILINHSMQRVLLSNASEYAEITSRKLQNELEFLYDKMDVFSMSIAGEREVQQLMQASYAKKAVYITEVEEKITYFKVLDPEIVDISLVNEEVHYSTLYTYEDLDSLRKQSKEKFFSWVGVRYSSMYTSAQKSPMLLYAREIVVNGEDVGTLLISINISSLQMDNSNEMDTCYLLADEENVIYSFDSTENKSDEIWKIWRNYNEEEEKDPLWYIQSRYLEKMGCYQISALDMGKISRRLSRIRILVWGCVILEAFFFLLLLWLIKGEVVKPLQDFYGVIHGIRSRGQRKLQGEIHLKGCTEIREIGEEFTGMMADISQLNRQIFDTATDLYEMKVKKQEAELSYMRSQIDPHFLYNTLEVFRKKALERKAPEIAEMAVDMGNIFRYSTKGSQTVTLGEEVSIIKSYVRIQKNRFMGKIEVFYYLPEEILHVPVMKMLLQPTVENAIYHGLEPKTERGNLYIGGRLELHDLVLTIKDDGVGIEKEKLLEIQELIEKDYYDTSKHVGILNTQARIRLQYGPGYGLQIESVLGDGTTVTIRVPAKENGPEGEGKGNV
ncbi:MAG TPA: hypothetical protein DCZ40_14215 [Lachnospiraceae bacterium]|nr:hypothetical protein [Lachnospiraceae bacterium]